MSRDEDKIYLGHMLDMTRRAISAIDSKSREAFDEDEILRLGLTHIVQVIGEAAGRVSEDFPKEHPEIPWRRIIGMRHRIVQDYMRVDEDILWPVVNHDLPDLLPRLEKILPDE